MKDFFTSASIIVEEESRISFRFLKLFLIAISAVCTVLLFAYFIKASGILQGTESTSLDFVLKIADGLS
ncbi:MAG: hypothetical protein BGO88_01145 [Flavobacterium sp. 38-13]|nr:hypothetical protein ASG38_03280 [Flavobacterium sp. Leaf359]OJX49157.1 MAG: hypothetical protein BGO88_01145 [Flavobacterium sp. 38-13]PZO28705.1 MAG: hypothetical protein DCE86_11785 [Flavobacteriaceae bacterium]PZQ90250.1 MAG: hypothetical protein DI548_03040 [Flavobacterium johnsoniae]